MNTEQVARFEYDAAGYRTLLSDANVGTINTQYTALGQVRWQQDSAGNITTTGYDLLGRPHHRGSQPTARPVGFMIRPMPSEDWITVSSRTVTPRIQH